jgi:hypothetical protein
MVQELRRFTVPITRPWLYRLMENPDSLPVETLDRLADLEGIQSKISQLIDENGDKALPAGQRSLWDRELIQPLYEALRSLPRKILVDMRFWHWLCILPLQDFVWYRWHGYIPEHPRRALSEHHALVGRFTGTPTLNGFSRNALSRLYWCASTLYSENEGFYWVELALQNQDLYQAIFERKFSLYPPAVKACLKELKDKTETERREATRRLNHHLTTIVLETLSEDDIRQLIDL